METLITGTNASTFPHLHIWNWTIAAYLFLGGLTAGVMVMSAIANIRKSKTLGADQACCVKGPLLAPFILALGMFFIMLDLERKFNSFWFYLSFNPMSPMSWGGWIVLVIFPLSFLYGLSVVPPELKHWLKFGFLKRLSNRLNPYMVRLAKINFGLGILLAIYTGVLLSAYLARPLWNSALLPILFLLSGLSTGTALLIIIARRLEVKLLFTKIDIWLIVGEIIVLILFFFNHYSSTEPHSEAIRIFFSLQSQYFGYFVAIVSISILFPMAIVIELLGKQEDHTEELSPSASFRMTLSAVLVLLGGLIIRLALVYAGQLSRLS
jgi:formate-dependent nitrite reductase membrane component NrfD